MWATRSLTCQSGSRLSASQSSGLLTMSKKRSCSARITSSIEARLV
jgi:hypothetical protein